MSLIRNSALPTFSRLKEEGRIILEQDRVEHQDIRELHIGFLNLMPDAALEATERQFFRLLGESNMIVQIHIHPFTLPIVERSAETQAYLDKYYEPIESIMAEGLDALIITGANEETNTHVSDETYWQPLKDILAWAYENVTSTLCSCLSSHAALTYNFGEEPSWQTEKCWGVFRHRVVDKAHPIVRGMNTIFDVPHSRHSHISREQFEKAGMRILVESGEAGVHMATSKDGLRLVCFQGHPEYDLYSLLKEYKREVINFMEGRRAAYPPFPTYYFNHHAQELAEQYHEDVKNGKAGEFPEQAIEACLENTWADSARSSVAAWIGLVYQVTHLDRKKPFMDGIDPHDSLKIV
jgi:homoserine O-succinyltransferase/O-acetyltransferase